LIELPDTCRSHPTATGRTWTTGRCAWVSRMPANARTWMCGQGRSEAGIAERRGRTRIVQIIGRCHLTRCEAAEPSRVSEGPIYSAAMYALLRPV
jgi:hypothetical protein